MILFWILLVAASVIQIPKLVAQKDKKQMILYIIFAFLTAAEMLVLPLIWKR